jgi:glycosyltransferase involved in cell wall biosynthesis
MSFGNHSIIIVTPVYEDREASSKLFKELSQLLKGQIYVVAIDDGSVKQPLEIDVLSDIEIEGVIIKLRRNVGHQKAIAIGIGYVAEGIESNQIVVVMDSDGEDLPASVLELIKNIEAKDIDIVVAKRKSRIETFRFKLFYAVYKRFFKLMTGRAISFGNFMALKPEAVKRMASMEETSIHIAGAVLASKLRTKECPLDRGPRYAGKSKMNFVGLALHGFKALMVFAEDVMVRVGLACAFIAGLSVFAIFTAITLKIVGYSTPGWFSVALGILLLILLQTGALSLMTLMLTGIVRGKSIVEPLSYKSFIQKIIMTSDDRH